MNASMSNGTSEVDVRLPERLCRRLATVAKAEKKDVNALIIDAVRADLAAGSRNSSKKKSPRP